MPAFSVDPTGFLQATSIDATALVGFVPLTSLSGITTLQLDPAAGILGSQLDASAGILGSQLDAAAGIVSGQIVSVDAATITGIVAQANGGTGLDTSAALDGQVLIGKTSDGSLNLATLSAGAGIAITNGAGSISIAATGSSGTVTSVGLSLPSELTVSGSPVTGAGTLTAVWATESANTLLAGPTSGLAATPGFRALVPADIPSLPGSIIGSGTVASAYLPATVAYTNVLNSFTQQQDIMTDLILRANASSHQGTVAGTTGVALGAFADTINTGSMVTIGYTGKLTASVGQQAALGIEQIINQSGTAGFDAIYVDATVIGSGSGAQNLLNLTLGGAPQFTVDTGGNLTLAGTVPAASLTGTVPLGSLSNLTTSQLSATAGILGSQLSATAAIASGQITSLDAAKLTGTVPLGTLSNLTTSQLSASAAITSGQIASIPNQAASIITSGQLALARGGTAIDSSGVTDGQLLIGQSSDHTFGLATLSAGSGVSIVNAGHSISISATGGSGTVTSVGLSLPAELTVSHSPVTGADTLTAVWANESANRVFAGPKSGSATTPSFRVLACPDMPDYIITDYTGSTLVDINTGALITVGC